MNLKILNELDRILKNNPNLKSNKHSYCQVVNGVFDIELNKIDDTEIHALAEQIDRAVLKNYFGKVWQAETKKFKYSGLAIIDEVNAMNPDNVIDIGCGYNEFKGKIQNLTGIDGKGFLHTNSPLVFFIGKPFSSNISTSIPNPLF